MAGLNLSLGIEGQCPEEPVGLKVKGQLQSGDTAGWWVQRVSSLTGLPARRGRRDLGRPGERSPGGSSVVREFKIGPLEGRGENYTTRPFPSCSPVSPLKSYILVSRFGAEASGSVRPRLPGGEQSGRSGLEPGLKLSLAPSLEPPASQHATAPFKRVTGGSGAGTLVVISNDPRHSKTSGFSSSSDLPASARETPGPGAPARRPWGQPPSGLVGRGWGWSVR